MFKPKGVLKTEKVVVKGSWEVNDVFIGDTD